MNTQNIMMNHHIYILWLQKQDYYRMKWHYDLAYTEKHISAISVYLLLEIRKVSTTKIRGALWKGTCDKCNFQTTSKWVLKRHISKVKQYEIQMWSMRFHYVLQKLLTYTPKYHASKYSTKVHTPEILSNQQHYKDLHHIQPKPAYD